MPSILAHIGERSWDWRLSIGLAIHRSVSQEVCADPSVCVDVCDGPVGCSNEGVQAFYANIDADTTIIDRHAVKS